MMGKVEPSSIHSSNVPGKMEPGSIHYRLVKVEPGSIHPSNILGEVEPGSMYCMPYPAMLWSMFAPVCVRICNVSSTVKESKRDAPSKPHP